MHSHLGYASMSLTFLSKPTQPNSDWWWMWRSSAKWLQLSVKVSQSCSKCFIDRRLDYLGMPPCKASYLEAGSFPTAAKLKGDVSIVSHNTTELGLNFELVGLSTLLSSCSGLARTNASSLASPQTPSAQTERRTIQCYVCIMAAVLSGVFASTPASVRCRSRSLT